MRRIAFVVALVAGCTKAVEPAPVAAPSRVTTRWVTLGEGFTAQNDRQHITLGPQYGSFRRIRVEGIHGRPVIQQVAIEYADREMQVVPVGQPLRPGQAEVIDLHGRDRGINRIIVFTAPGYGAYSVFGT
jgi:hypothetical protein